MFEGIINSQKKEAISSEKRQQKDSIDSMREQSLNYAATNPNEDQMYETQQLMRSDLLRWQQDLGDELLDLVMTLKGCARTEKNKWVAVTKPLCNDKFIYDVVIPQCKPYLSRSYINSNLDVSTIWRNLRFTSGDISNRMADGFDAYGIDFEDYDLIKRMIKNVIVPSSFRALNGWTKKIDSTMIRRVEAMHENGNDQNNDKKLFGLFK